jgi:hypothetical protein
MNNPRPKQPSRPAAAMKAFASFSSAHKKGGVVLSAYHATQGRRIVQTSLYTSVNVGGSGDRNKFIPIIQSNALNADP